MPVLTPMRPVAKNATLETVRQAVFQKTPVQQTSLRKLHVAVSLLLSAGILTMLNVNVLQMTVSTKTIARVRDGSTLSLALLPSATQTQTQILLQALLALPQVRDVSFTDRVEILPRSLDDVPSLIGFLHRPELQPVLASASIEAFSRAHEQILASLSLERMQMRRAMAGAVASILLLFLALLLFLRNRADVLRDHLALLALFGASERKLRRPLLHESLFLLGGAFLLAVFCTIVVAAFVGPWPTTMQVLPWVLFLEVATLAVLAWLTVRMGMPFLLTSSPSGWRAS